MSFNVAPPILLSQICALRTRTFRCSLATERYSDKRSWSCSCPVNRRPVQGSQGDRLPQHIYFEQNVNKYAVLNAEEGKLFLKAWDTFYKRFAHLVRFLGWVEHRVFKKNY